MHYGRRERFLSRRFYALRFKDLACDSWFLEIIEHAPSSFEWANDSMLLPYQVWRHMVGMPTTIFEVNLDAGERKLLKQTQVKNFQEDHYRS